jgi:hypothetical protein
MPDFTLAHLIEFKTALVEYNKPTINNINRLEGNPRTAEFEKSLRAEVRDPLWMLCRQWQFGEFQGEDAGSAWQASILGEHTTPKTIRYGNGVEMEFSKEIPLETLVERENLTPDLHLRIQMGRQLMKIVKQQSLQAYKTRFLEKYPITQQPDVADIDGRMMFGAVKGRFPDGWEAFSAMKSGEYMTWVAAVDFEKETHRARMEVVQEELFQWFENLYQQPGTGQNAWSAAHLEYNFELLVPSKELPNETLSADQYSAGRLDWFSFDTLNRTDVVVPANPPSLAVKEKVQTFLPMPLEFSGMPNPRYWQMEDRRTDFGKLDTNPKALLQVLLAEYGLTYSNDWFVLPYELKINTLCEIKGILVTDVFGFNTYINPAIKDPEMNWREFAMFHQTERNNDLEGRNRYYYPPSIGKRLEGDAIEKVNFIRDEMTNMVWAIEQVLPSETGEGRAVKLKTPSLPDFVPADDVSKIRYVLGTNVPENWIPFVPVQSTANPREMRLQRGRLPQSAAPKSKLLTETQPVFFVEEEEVPRSGIIVERRFQRTRWLNGKTLLWVGRRKMAGRGEGLSGLTFDQLVDVKRG